jgi:hypothetical protein
MFLIADPAGGPFRFLFSKRPVHAPTVQGGPWNSRTTHRTHSYTVSLPSVPHSAHARIYEWTPPVGVDDNHAAFRLRQNRLRLRRWPQNGSELRILPPSGGGGQKSYKSWLKLQSSKFFPRLCNMFSQFSSIHHFQVNILLIRWINLRVRIRI